MYLYHVKHKSTKQTNIFKIPMEGLQEFVWKTLDYQMKLLITIDVKINRAHGKVTY